MKQVWVNWPTWSRTPATTRSAALPTLTTAIPEPKSIRELPSASTRTPPPARATKTGSIVATPGATAASLRASNARDRGPGISVTRRRSCASAGPPVGSRLTVDLLGPWDLDDPRPGPVPGLPGGNAASQHDSRAGQPDQVMAP